jgi:hypothetical protein
MKKSIIKTFFYILLFVPLLFSFGSCDQEEIFFLISQDFEWIEPLIKGSPTNFATFTVNGTERMYVASGKKLWHYANSRWAKSEEFVSENPDSPDPDVSYININGTHLNTGEIRISHIASTNEYLYVLLLDNSERPITREIWRMDTGGRWALVTGTTGYYTVFQSIYSANNTLYIGAQRNNANDYGILEVNADGKIEETVIKGSSSHLLYGAASNGSQTFLCTLGGIYLPGSNRPITGSLGLTEEDEPVVILNFLGIITLEDNTVVAITRDGKLYEVSAGVVTEKAEFGDDRWSASGALATWKDRDAPDNIKRLLAGRLELSTSLTTGHTFGYMEMELDAGGGLSTAPSFASPTLTSDSGYSSSLGTLPVNHLFQAPNGYLFASTQRDGVWVFREHRVGAEPTWNAEWQE